MDYLRKIVYLNEYEDGECSGNIGFIKLSKKQTRLKIEISLSGDRTLRGEKIYLLDKDKSAVNKVFFGTITEDGNQINMTRNTGETGMLKGELAGILIGGEGYVVCAGMEDESVQVTDYIRMEKGRTEESLKSRESRKSQESLAEQIESEIGAMGDRGNGQGDTESGRDKMREWETEQESVETETRQQEGQESLAEQIESELEMQEEGEEEEEIIEVELEEERDLAHMIQKMFATQPNMYPFEDDELEECVQISPENFSDFPKEYWHMGSNTFLLQGYYNYRHLLLARKGDKIYIGIPGQYHRRDKYMADMFGFGDFKCIQKKNGRIGDFGYWMKEIGIPPASEDMVCVSE